MKETIYSILVLISLTTKAAYSKNDRPRVKEKEELEFISSVDDNIHFYTQMQKISKLDNSPYYDFFNIGNILNRFPHQRHFFGRVEMTLPITVDQFENLTFEDSFIKEFLNAKKLTLLEEMPSVKKYEISVSKFPISVNFNANLYRLTEEDDGPFWYEEFITILPKSLARDFYGAMYLEGNSFDKIFQETRNIILYEQVGDQVFIRLFQNIIMNESAASKIDLIPFKSAYKEMKKELKSFAYRLYNLAK